MLKIIEDFINEESDNNTLEDYQALLDILFNTNQSLTDKELEILVKFFPEDANKEIEDSFIQIVQSVECSRSQFNDILQNIPSDHIRQELCKKMKYKH